jgi:hypothetical protein
VAAVEALVTTLAAKIHQIRPDVKTGIGVTSSALTKTRLNARRDRRAPRG